MKNWVLIWAICLALPMGMKAQQAEIIKFAGLQHIFESHSDTTYILNFWATWCIPCVKEFPAFQAFAEAHKNEKIKVVMISLDFKKDFNSALLPFLKKHPIDARVCLLDEPDYNSWIDKVNPKWQGEIPVTFMFNNARGIHAFFPQDFTPAALQGAYDKVTNRPPPAHSDTVIQLNSRH